ncbi:hypothetical protein Pint_03693 [Pistacia integerrima]|uniref:Uncharacterized protein n=1 Tax=Pistacia integerrima TaxID=434235 RepID=A0ACC0Z692_9ROSI|nr:hypothetical protein Pint_03693 [Pistacia integerrima]
MTMAFSCNKEYVLLVIHVCSAINNGAVLLIINMQYLLSMFSSCNFHVVGRGVFLNFPCNIYFEILYLS